MEATTIETKNTPVIVREPRKAPKRVEPLKGPARVVEGLANLYAANETPAKSDRKQPKKIVPAKSSSERTPLKKVCASLKIDPKTARRVLRRENFPFHELGNRWDLTDAQTKRVKEVLREYVAG
jgi:hypothetical protein